ncbi:MAG: hypothetical protein IIZ48_04020 [Erysipelotrichales bacterium]|nr:hypothetical protein [Erysipelotrichales bacterium]
MENKHYAAIGYGWVIFAYAYFLKGMTKTAIGTMIIGIMWNFFLADGSKTRNHTGGLALMTALFASGYLLSESGEACVLGILHSLAAYLAFGYLEDEKDAEILGGLGICVSVIAGLFLLTLAAYMILGMGSMMFFEDFGWETLGLAAPSLWVLTCRMRFRKPVFQRENAVQR